MQRSHNHRHFLGLRNKFFFVVLLHGITNETIGVSSSSGEDLRTLEMKPFSGLYVTEQDSPSSTKTSLYTTVAPILFGFKVPKWNNQDFVLPIVNCTSPNWNDSTTCPTVYYLGAVQERFSDYFFNGQPLVNRFKWMGGSPQKTDIEFECYKLGRHFKDIYADQGVIERYIEKIKRCSPLRDMEFFRHIANYDYNISSIYRQMRESYSKEVWLKIHDGRIDAGLWSNAQTILHSLNFLNHHIELTRWNFGLSDCISGRIPSSLVTPELMEDTLQDLVENAGKGMANLSPVIPTAEVGDYFKEQLVDCLFSDESLFVRILVPLIPKNDRYSLYSIHSPTFYNYVTQQLCHIQVTQEMIIFDNLKRIAYDLQCSMKDEFCYIPETISDRYVNPCISAILNNDWQETLGVCPFSCKDKSKYQKEKRSIIQVTPGKIFITTTTEASEIGAKPSAEIMCGEEKALFPVPNVRFGSLEVTVPCGCSLNVQSSNISFKNEDRCRFDKNQKPQFRNLIPLQWLTKEAVAKVFQRNDLNTTIIRKEDLDLHFKTADQFHFNTPTDLEPGRTSGGESLFMLMLSFILLFLCTMFCFLVFKLKKLGVDIWGKSVRVSELTYQHISAENDL